MQSPPRSDPSYVPIRSSSWPVRRTPKWAFLVALVLLAFAIVVGLAHKPSTAERASDMRGFLQEINTDIGSCAAGVHESLVALADVQAGHNSAADVKSAISDAQYGASNCSPANSMPIDDLQSYQVPESLDSYRLVGVVTGLVNWAAPDAINAQNDVAKVLAAKTPAAKASAEAALQQALNKLNKQRAAVDTIMARTIKALGMHAALPSLPG